MQICVDFQFQVAASAEALICALDSVIRCSNTGLMVQELFAYGETTEICCIMQTENVFMHDTTVEASPDFGNLDLALIYCWCRR